MRAGAFVRGALALALAALAGLVALSPLTLVGLAQGTSTSSAQAQQQAAEVLLNLTQRAIQAAESAGVNVTKAEQMYSEALNYYKQGEYSQAITVAIGIMRLLAGELRQQKPAPMPQAVGIYAQLKAIEAYASSSTVLNATQKERLLAVVSWGLENLSKGNVTAAAEALQEAKELLSNYSVSVSQYARHAMIGRIARMMEHAKHRAEEAWSFLEEANVSPSEEAEAVFGFLERLINRSAVNATPGQLVQAAVMAEELAEEAPQAEPFPNASGRVILFIAQAHVLRVINQSASMVSSMLQYLTGSQNQTAEEALKLLQGALNDTYTAVVLYVKGNDTGALIELNESMSLANQSLMLAENLTVNGTGPAKAVGELIAKADRLLIKVDERLYIFISSQNIVGKTFEFDAVLLYRINETAYIGVARIVNGTTPHEHVIFVLVEITSSTKVIGNLTYAQLPVRVELVGTVTGRVGGLYVVTAENITLVGPWYPGGQTS